MDREVMEDVLSDGGSYIITCKVCGKAIELWYNGGELDRRECCGYEYRLYYANPRIDLAVTAKGKCGSSAANLT